MGALSEWAPKLLFEYCGWAIFCWMLYRLIDRWAEKFLDAHVSQVKAMVEQAAATTALAQAVRESQDNGQKILMAVQILADRQERTHKYLELIEDRYRQEGQRGSA